MKDLKDTPGYELLYIDHSPEYVKVILDENPKEVKEYNEGATGLMGFFMGKVMTASRGTCNPAKVKEELEIQLLNRIK